MNSIILLYIYISLIQTIVYIESTSRSFRIPQSSNYKWVYPFINSSFVKSIFEVGSRDLKDGNNLAHHFSCRVYSFEANPDNYDDMIRNNLDDRVNFVRTAVSDVDGYVIFYPYNLTLYNNRGAGSLLLADFVTNRNIGDADYNRSPVQYERKVNSTRLDTFINKVSKIPPDLLAIDVQESELTVLKSLGNYIDHIKYIILETTFYTQYHFGQNFSMINQYLNSRNFKMKVLKYQGKGGLVYTPPSKPINGGGDVLYINLNHSF